MDWSGDRLTHGMGSDDAMQCDTPVTHLHVLLQDERVPVQVVAARVVYHVVHAPVIVLLGSCSDFVRFVCAWIRSCDSVRCVCAIIRSCFYST